MRDLHEFMDSAQPWAKYKAEIEQLNESGRVFFSKHNINAYAETRTQVHQRLHSVLRDDRIARMLAAERNELDLDRYLNDEGMVLVDTASGELGLENSAFFGRLFVLLAQQTMMRRKPDDRANIPTFLVCDEAQEYFKADAVFRQFIDQGRKRSFALIVAHHRFSQAPAALQDAFEQVGVHFATQVAPSDMPRLSSIFRASREFMQAQHAEPVGPNGRPTWADFAFIPRGHQQPVSVRVAYGVLENFDTSTFNWRRTSQQRNRNQQGSGHQQRQSAPPPPPPPPQGKRGPNDLEWEITVSPIKARDGGVIENFKLPNGRIVNIRIPRGTKDGAVLRFAKCTQMGGDLYIKLKVPEMPEQPKDKEQAEKPRRDSEDMDTGSAPWP
jgi:hypothetical protein